MSNYLTIVKILANLSRQMTEVSCGFYINEISLLIWIAVQHGHALDAKQSSQILPFILNAVLIFPLRITRLVGMQRGVQQLSPAPKNETRPKTLTCRIPSKLNLKGTRISSDKLICSVLGLQKKQVEAVKIFDLYFIISDFSIAFKMMMT
ncbi:hypothetical protein BpHYR1_042154 [Brachionus plicatilis]|uniref:Uncharacterized protein n=1 Tax=Brachionus plicatilis TaxID=10195 RepID=A0A3M7QFV1_BRAPC|nr:hypothetical protein BpHYR1_042154 [Brachionus plicatilis]